MNQHYSPILFRLCRRIKNLLDKLKFSSIIEKKKYLNCLALLVFQFNHSSINKFYILI